jgi:hypothetical protein
MRVRLLPLASRLAPSHGTSRRTTCSPNQALAALLQVKLSDVKKLEAKGKKKAGKK